MRRLLVLSLLVSLLVGDVSRAQYASPVVVSDPLTETTRIEAELTTARAELAEAEARHARATTELEQLAPRKAAASEGMRKRVRALYRMKRAGYLPVAGGFDAMLTHLARMERLERVVESDAQSIAYYDRRTAVLEEEAREATSGLEALRARVAGLEARKASIEAELGTQLGDPWLAGPLSGLGGQEGYGHLGVVPLPEQTPLAAPGSPSLESPVSGFALLRGRLGAPVARALAVRDAVRDDGPGLEFVVSAGTQVHAVAEGRVAYAGTYGSYGRVIILDHADSFYTVYGGLGQLGVRVGDSVVRGTQLAEVGGARPMVFFEVRRSTRTLDPRSWTGL